MQISMPLVRPPGREQERHRGFNETRCGTTVGLRRKALSQVRKGHGAGFKVGFSAGAEAEHHHGV